MGGRIEKTTGSINPAYEIQVDGFRAMRFMDYSTAEAIKRYREIFGLKGRKIDWRDYTKPDMPKNLYEAVMDALRFENGGKI